jgi:hypothetical protein
MKEKKLATKLKRGKCLGELCPDLIALHDKAAALWLFLHRTEANPIYERDYYISMKSEATVTFSRAI